jgi:hypothetical protein
MKKLIVLAAFCSLGLWGASAHANNKAWRINAGACVPTDVDVMLQGTHYWTVTGGMRVKHKGTDTNDINLVCPVTSLDATTTAPNALIVYHGNTGGTTNANYSVTASLRSVKLEVPNAGTYNASECTLSSHAGLTTLSGASWAMSYCHFSSALDLDNYAYWVEITIHRADSNQSPEVSAIAIGYVAPGSGGDGGCGGGSSC